MGSWLAATERSFFGDPHTNTAPTEFITQILEPTGGKILRPKDWFYCEDHRGPKYMWTISREDASDGRRYTTGVRIQVFSRIKAGVGKTAEQFIRDFVHSKQSAQCKVIRTFPEVQMDMFCRIGLETEEGADHILYSLFWGSNELDLAVVSIAGTKKEFWETYALTFQKMGEFEIIDMNRFGK